MKVKIKRLSPDAEIPKYAKPGDAGMDLVAVSRQFNEKTGCVEYGTGISMEIPEGYVGLIFPRSSIYKTGLNLTNCVGVIDSGYRGEIKAVFATRFLQAFPKRMLDRIRLFLDPYYISKYTKKYGNGVEPTAITYVDNKVYDVGDRIMQIVIMPYPTIEFEECEELSETERGEGGYGSTGR